MKLKFLEEYLNHSLFMLVRVLFLFFGKSVEPSFSLGDSFLNWLGAEQLEIISKVRETTKRPEVKFFILAKIEKALIGSQRQFRI